MHLEQSQKAWEKDKRNWKSEGESRPYIDEISPNTEESPGNIRRLAHTETSVKDYQLVEKFRNEWKDNPVDNGRKIKEIKTINK